MNWQAIEMPDMVRKLDKGRRVVLPEGWLATVPVVEYSEEVVRQYMRYHMQDGLSEIAARRRVVESGQGLYNYAHLHGLKECVMHYARRYAKLWPSKVEEVQEGLVHLVGFDPERVAVGYVPGQRPGKEGLPFMRELLREMADMEGA